MTMADDARREVAARLRDAADENAITACGGRSLVVAIGRMVGHEDMAPSGLTMALGEMEEADQRLLRRLADLIDPDGGDGDE